MAQASITVTPRSEIIMRQLQAIPQIIERNAATMGTELEQVYVRLAREEAPSRSGMFRERITTTPWIGAGLSSASFAGISERPLGLWIQEGTDPHPIPPRGDNRLIFYWEREHRMFIGERGQAVNHPGTKPNPFAERAVNRMLPIVDALAARTGQNISIEIAAGIA